MVETLEKDLEKLKRQKENILLRRTLAVKGSIDDRTEEEKAAQTKANLKGDLEGMAVHLIEASPKKI